MALMHGEAPPDVRERKALVENTLAGLACLMIGTIIAALVVRSHASMSWNFVAAATVLLSAMFGFVLYFLPSYPHRRFGYANMVTALRASLVSLTAAAVLCHDSLHQAGASLWILAGVVLFILALDGVDGYLARRYRQESALGARFDMEVDAVLILILSIAAAVMGKAGDWVLLIGLMRYLFVIAGWFVQALNAVLPPSLRRKSVCVVQVSTLCLILVPPVAEPVSGYLAAISLVLLSISFAIDIVYLLRKRPAT